MKEESGQPWCVPLFIGKGLDSFLDAYAWAVGKEYKAISIVPENPIFLEAK